MARAAVPIPVPKGFNLRATVRSHGWSDLRPFETDASGDTLVVNLGRCAATVRHRNGRVRADLVGPGRIDRTAAAAAVASCLRTDLDLEPFYALCRDDPELAWVPRLGAGRFLRAPTAFADAAMILATTNCSWALTRRIVAALVERWGENGAFPTQEAIAGARTAELKRWGRLGYRAPYLAALARGPALAGFRDDDSATPELRRRLLELPGFGPYAAENFLRALGRFDYLALDSLVVKRWKERYPRRRPTERAIARNLARYGPWKGLAFWMLITEPWHRRTAWRL